MGRQIAIDAAREGNLFVKQIQVIGLRGNYFVSNGLINVKWPDLYYDTKLEAETAVRRIREEAGLIEPTPSDKDQTVVRVPWTLLAALDILVAHAGNDKTIVAKELRKYTDDDAKVRLSGAEAFYQEHVEG